MKNKFLGLRNKIVGAGAVVSAAAVSVSASAQSVLPTDFSMDNTNADILIVGGAMIGLAVTAVGIKWVKATFFG